MALSLLKSSPLKSFNINQISNPRSRSFLSLGRAYVRSGRKFVGCYATMNNISECDCDNGKPGPLVVISFYKFADLPDYENLRQPLAKLCEDHRVSGGIILAPEGINGSICGTKHAVQKVLCTIEEDIRLKNLRKNESPASEDDEKLHDGHHEKSPLGAGKDAPFRWDHVRVKVKKEVVPLGIEGIYPSRRVGKYVKPKDWNDLIADPETVLIDVRNTYEIRIGKFRGAVDPQTASFREFPAWVERFLKRQKIQFDEPELSSSIISGTDHVPAAPRRIATYCTGGIRCEKATSLLLNMGFEEVYHLEGGILKYLAEIPSSKSLWEGECFVFDKRVSVEHGLAKGNYQLCYACKKPISENDLLSPKWEYGISCPYCYLEKSDEEKERARARQRQFEMWGVIGGPDKGRRKTLPGLPVKTT